MEIIPSVRQRYHLIPIGALVGGDGDTGFVYVPDQTRTQAQKIAVRVDHIFNQEIAIRSGLENVAEVITSGSQYLRDGCPIEILQSKTERANPASDISLERDTANAAAEITSASEISQ